MRQLKDTSTDSTQAPLQRLYSKEEISRCIEVMNTLTDDRLLLAQLEDEERLNLMKAAGRLSRPQKYESIKLAKELRSQHRQRERKEDRAARATTQIRAAREVAVYVPPPLLPAGEVAAEEQHAERPELHTPQMCYQCKEKYTKLHFFYDSMCKTCGDLNYRKRSQTASLAGRTALITGARLKIGYQAALMMLRAGAKVIVTTRFPHDSALRYAREPDYGDWCDRLSIHGLDLRHAPSVEIFTRYIDQTQDRLDILINNAAQTVRRPPGFYGHLLDLEMKALGDLPKEAQRLLVGHEECKAVLSRGHALSAGNGSPSAPGLAAWNGGNAGVGLRQSAQLSQLAYDFEDSAKGLEVFPQGKLDADLQQVDLRTMNSWRMTLADVPTPEMLEVHLINAVAPFILCSKLKPLMLRDRTDEKHIVNVSAMEGKFTRYTKTDKHPHTNMAKAALNMMTLTSAPDYAKDGIFMNAVDTGWVTDEDPAHHATRKREELDFQPPLDIVDGAARVCDPFFSGLLTGVHVYGKFLKDYGQTDW